MSWTRIERGSVRENHVFVLFRIVEVINDHHSDSSNTSSRIIFDLPPVFLDLKKPGSQYNTPPH
jgi:hypothetical protein